MHPWIASCLAMTTGGVNGVGGGCITSAINLIKKHPMGIITKLSFLEVSSHLKIEYGLRLLSIKPTKDGVSDSVYLIKTNTQEFALKVFEATAIEQIRSEHSLLHALLSLPVAQPFRRHHIPLLHGKPSTLYRALTSSGDVELTGIHATVIGDFLSRMHCLSRTLQSDNPSFASRYEALKPCIANTPFEPYAYLIDEMLLLPDEGVIHGDIFLDNVIFGRDGLSGVVDFIEAARGSFAFDIGVVAFSFCTKNGIVDFEKLSRLIDAYECQKYSPKELLLYASYAALFYGLGRFTGGRNWNECLLLLENYA